MPNEKQLKNLIPFSELTEDEQRKIASNGGKKSGIVRREKKLLKQVAEEKLNKIIQGITFQDFSLDTLIDYCQKEDAKPEVILKILEFLRDTSGQKPKEEVQAVVLPLINIKGL